MHAPGSGPYCLLSTIPLLDLSCRQPSTSNTSNNLCSQTLAAYCCAGFVSIDMRMATQRFTPPMAFDRRSRTRPPDPSCRACRATPDLVHVTVRTAGRLYFRCDKCGEVWDIATPQRRGPQALIPLR
jgi:hypothetical protein